MNPKSSSDLTNGENVSDIQQKILNAIQDVSPVSSKKEQSTGRWALIVVDVQNDFIRGSLATKDLPNGEDGEEVVPAINHLLNYVNFDLVIYSRDWHPEDHCSFITNETKCAPPYFKKWPPHCIQHQKGAEYDSRLNIKPPNTKIIHVLKGYEKCIECFSVFGGMIDQDRSININTTKRSIEEIIKEEKIDSLFISGLATDVCVLETCKDAKVLLANLETYLLIDCVRGTKPFTYVWEFFNANSIKLTTSLNLIQGCSMVQKKLHPRLVNNKSDKQKSKNAEMEIID